MSSAHHAAPEAYAFPLLIKQLWNAPMSYAAEQEIVYRDRRLSYRQLRERVGRLGSVLNKLDIGMGDTVAVMDWDSHRYLECYYAVPMIGAVLMTVNVRLAPEQIIYTLNHSEAEILLVNSDFRDVLSTIWPKLESVRQIIWMSDDDAAAPHAMPCAGEYESLLGAADPACQFPDFDENTRATTFYTTGTTGLPKGVFFTHRQLVLHTLAMMAALASPAGGQRFHRGDVYMPLTPMFHVHAWGIPYVALQLGVKQVYPGRYQPEVLLQLIKREGVTFSHCVPTILQMILGAPGAGDADLSRWKIVIGGSALPTGLAGAARERGIDIFGGYGMSETCPVLALAQLHPNLGALDVERELGFRCKAGVAVPLVELRTVDENMRDVPPDGSTGEVVARAPWLTQGYWKNPAASAALWSGGYLHTQDIGYLEAGYLKVTDRIKDVIKSGGEWVSSVQIEDLLSAHPAVREAAVIGIKDDKWGERPLALVVLESAAHPTIEDELKQYLGKFADAGTISRYAVPVRVLTVEAIARTSVGKIDKKLLREHYV
jgi:acyl-CoA synthetase (AMP-forming)/AMP-acid ligase II